MYKSIAFLLLLCSTALGAKEQTICLNMIVKNESAAIKKCLSSVKPLIDYWVIVDTGSTDGTQEIIKEFMKEVPGEVHERPWVNFGHNRDEALKLAKGKGDYVLFMDADEELVFTSQFSFPRLTKDYYLIPLHREGAIHLHASLINNHLNWKWHGVLHEELICPEAVTFDTLEHIKNLGDSKDGHRAQDPHKFLKDAAVLEEALKTDPHNPRYVFYLAQCYHCAEKYDLAMKYYEARTKLEGWDAERYLAFYKLGVLQEHAKLDPDLFLTNHSKAFECFPFRSEPLLRIANHFFMQKQYVIGYAVAKLGLSIPFPKNDLMYIEPSVYDHELLLTCANCALGLRQFAEAKALYEELLKKETLPEGTRSDVIINLQTANRFLTEGALR